MTISCEQGKDWPAKLWERQTSHWVSEKLELGTEMQLVLFLFLPSLPLPEYWLHFFFFFCRLFLSCASCETWLLSACVSHFTTPQRSSLSLSHLRRILGKGSGPASARCPTLGKPTNAKGQEGFPGGVSGKEPACQCRRRKRHRFDSWVRKIPWRRMWQPIPVFLPGESHRQEPGRLYSP